MKRIAGVLVTDDQMASAASNGLTQESLRGSIRLGWSIQDAIASGLTKGPGRTKYGDLADRRFGRFVVIGPSPTYRSPNGTRFTMWTCRCDCGVERAVRQDALFSGHTQSCGCLARELAQKSSTTHGATRGHTQTREHKAWANMLARCRNPKAHYYANYGGRGIRVCQRWLAFENFLADMRLSPGRGYSIDRVDNDKGYEPGNCRWATLSQQARNTRRNRLYELDGQRKCLSDWAEELNLSANTIRARIRRGATDAEALCTTKSRKAPR